LNQAFQEHWVVRFCWAELVCAKDGNMQMVRCKVCSTIEGREKFLVPKLDSLVKHFGLKKYTFAKLGFAVGQFYSCPTNTHIKNEKLVASKGRDIILAYLHNGVR